MDKKIGFNFLWMFSCHGDPPGLPDERELDFVADHGFNFVRIPTDYRFWTKNFDYLHPDESVIEYIDGYIGQINRRGMHASLNLHRAPGYCINRPELEKHNLWRDPEAQEGFIRLWEYFTHRYAGISSEKLSFDLINEPCSSPPTHPCTRADHEKLIRRTISAIKAIDPNREIVIDGFDGGGTALPELADAGAIHSGRGYEPFQLTHYRAEWTKLPSDQPEPSYPGEVAPGVTRNIETLREYYKPWKAVEESGCRVHMGECGIYNKLSNDIALRWFRDLVEVFNENGWGYALWNFRGPFGICEHGRPNTVYTEDRGMEIDRAMLELMQSSLGSPKHPQNKEN